MEPKPHVFHVPIGWQRDGNGKVVLFRDEAESAAGMEVWMEMYTNHPATLAAGTCVIIGPTQTQYMDFRQRVVHVSKAADEAWEPGAFSPCSSRARTP